MLDQDQISNFNRDGFIILRDAIEPSLVNAMAAQLDKWIDESRTHASNYGEMLNGKMRFDLEQGHTREHPRLRRVGNPVDISEPFQQVLWQGAVVNAVADLIGPDVKFHHCKLNIKLPNTNTRVDYHQDHPFDPHTNDDHAVVLVMVDDMNENNGCLRIVPGSHKGPHFTHYDGDTFTGKVDEATQKMCQEQAVSVEGRAGDVCIMTGWSLHGGTANKSSNPRRLLICDYFAADAFPLLPPMVASEHHGKIVSGYGTRVARFREGTVELPYHYEHDSFFGAQGQKAAVAMN